MRFNLDDYVTVQERINRFWVDHPNGSISTELMSLPEDFTACRYKAAVYRTPEEVRPAATGFAFELAGGGGANSTSHEENGETSAIGRALANLGYATSLKDRPSREEMRKVNNGTPAQHARPVRPTADDITTVPLSKPTEGDLGRTAGGASWKSLMLLYGETKRLGMLTPPDNRGETHHDEAWLMQEAYERFDDPSLVTSEDLSQKQVSQLIDALKAQGAPRQEERDQRVSPDAYRTADQRTNGAVPADIHDWNQFWRFAKAQGIDTPGAYEQLVGRKNTSMSPGEAAQALADAFVQPHLTNNVVG